MPRRPSKTQRDKETRDLFVAVAMDLAMWALVTVLFVEASCGMYACIREENRAGRNSLGEWILERLEERSMGDP